MDAGTVFDVQVMPSASPAQSDVRWAEEHLGPKHGKWDGYDQIENRELRTQVIEQVGLIHGLTAQTGRSVLGIGQSLQRLKDILPHGQFSACAKAEFGFSRDWCAKLMAIAAHFANVIPGIHLPSNAKVLLVLAAVKADAETIAQARAEGWSEQETKRRVGLTGKPVATRPMELRALATYRKAPLAEIEAELALIRQITTVTESDVLAEVGLRKLPKGKLLQAKGADFHRRPDGSGWDRIPHAGRVDATTCPDAQQVELVMQSGEPVGSDDDEVMARADAAKLLGITPQKLSMKLNPKTNPNGVTLSGFLVTREGHGVVRLVRTS